MAICANPEVHKFYQDVDVDLYRSSVKKQIKDWHTAVSQRKHQEWLILHIVRPDARMPTANFFHLKGSVLDKMRTDFNVDRRDRSVCLHLLALHCHSPLIDAFSWCGLLMAMTIQQFGQT
jgi:hypothetical protein